jgi:hypothetical protein
MLSSPHVLIPQLIIHVGDSYSRKQLFSVALSSIKCESGSSVSIVSGYGLNDRAIGIRSPAEAKGFFL